MLIFSFLVPPEGTTLTTISTHVVHEIDSVTLTCTANESIPPPSVYRFYHSGELVQATSKNTYIMNPALKADEGTYKCYPINDVGPGTDATITLEVEGTTLLLFFHFSKV